MTPRRKGEWAWQCCEEDLHEVTEEGELQPFSMPTKNEALFAMEPKNWLPGSYIVKVDDMGRVTREVS